MILSGEHKKYTSKAVKMQRDLEVYSLQARHGLFIAIEDNAKNGNSREALDAIIEQLQEGDRHPSFLTVAKVFPHLSEPLQRLQATVASSRGVIPETVVVEIENGVREAVCFMLEKCKPQKKQKRLRRV